MTDNPLNMIEQCAQMANKGLFKDAAELGEKAIALYEKEYAIEDINYAIALTNLATSYSELGQYDKAIKLYEKGLKIKKKTHGKNDNSVANTLYRIAHAYKSIQKLKEAEKYYKQAIKIKEDLHIVEDVYHEVSLTELGDLYLLTKEYDDAEKYIKKYLDLSSNRTSGNYFFFLDVLVKLYLHKGKPNLIKKLLGELYSNNDEQYRQLQEKYLGDKQSGVTDRDKGWSQINNKVMDAYQKRDYKAYEKYGREAMAYAETHYGKQDIHFTVALNSLAVCYQEQRKYDKAEPLFLEAYKINKQIVSMQDSNYIAPINNLVNFYKESNDYLQAATYLDEIADREEKVYGRISEQYISALNDRLQLAMQFRQPEDADKTFITYCTLFKDAHGEDSKAYVSACNRRAAYFQEIQEYDKALSIYKDVLSLMQKKYDTGSMNYAAILNNLGVVCRKLNDLPEAESYLQQALEIIGNEKGKQNPDYAQALGNLALVYDHLQKKEAEGLYLESLSIKENTIGKNHADYALSLNNLGLFYYDHNQIDKAVSCLEDAVKTREVCLGSDSPDLAISLHNLAICFDMEGKIEEAENAYTKALSILDKNYGKDNIAYSRTLNGMATMLTKRKKYDKALKLYDSALLVQKKKLGLTHISTIITLSNQAYVHWLKKDFNKADKLFNQVCSNYLSVFISVSKYLTTNEKYHYWAHLGKFNGMYFSYVLNRYDTNKQITSDCYNQILNTKGLLIYKSHGIADEEMEKLSDKHKELYETWLANRTKVTAAWHNQNGKHVDEIKKETDDIERQLIKLGILQEVKADEGRTFDWRDIRKALGKDEAAIEIIRVRDYLGEQGRIVYLALIITTSCKKSPLMLKLGNGEQMEQELYQDYEKSRRFTRKGIYDQYWGIIKQALDNIKRVYLSVDGIYNKINLNILYNPDEKQYLIDELEIVNLTNTRELLEKGNESSNRNAVLFGRPDYGPGHVSDHEKNAETFWKDLASTQKEVEESAELLAKYKWKTSVKTGKKATAEELLAVNQPRLLHIATHGYFTPVNVDLYKSKDGSLFSIISDSQHGTSLPGKDALNQALQDSGIIREDKQLFDELDINDVKLETHPMLRSGLVMAGANSQSKNYTLESGYLTAYEVAGLNLTDTDLVVLSACETGLGEMRGIEGVYGLQRAFKVAGAENIIISLWKVDDSATQYMMKNFYEEWLSTSDMNHAFRSAQLQTREEFRLPMFWGGFILIGKGHINENN